MSRLFCFGMGYVGTTSPTSPGEPTSAAARLCVWLNELRIRTLNVAGNRAGQAPGIAALATAVLERALGDIEDESRARGVRQRSVLLDAMASYRKWQLIAVVRAGSGAVHKSWAWAAGGQPEWHDRGRAPGETEEHAAARRRRR